jgi:hypothetical protein
MPQTIVSARAQTMEITQLTYSDSPVSISAGLVSSHLAGHAGTLFR